MNIKRVMYSKLEKILYVKLISNLTGRVFYIESLSSSLKSGESILRIDSAITSQVKTDLAKIKRQEIKI
jgi:hypothetical protein